MGYTFFKKKWLYLNVTVAILAQGELLETHRNDIAMQRNIPAREVPKKGILQDVRCIIRTQVRMGVSLKDIQKKLEYEFDKDFTLFMFNWVRFHPESGVILREAYLRRCLQEKKTANTDDNWRSR